VKNTLIVIAILLLCLDGIGVYRAFTEYRNLNQQLQQEADYVRDINLISQKNQEYYQSLSSISDNFYTDERLYNLWRTMEDKFGANLDSLTIEPNYTEENGLRWFTFNISVRTNPKAFLQTIKSVSPPLFVQSISYNRSANVLTAPVRGAIVSDYSGFVITASTIAESNYVVCQYREIRRRTAVVGVFPNMDSYIRLITTYLIEYSEEWSTGRSYIKPEIIQLTKEDLSKVA